MSLPKAQVNVSSNNKKRIEALVLPLGVVVLVAIILLLGFVLPKLRQDSNANKKNIDQFTQPKTVKTAEGKTQSVTPQVLQITPEQLKTMIDRKEKIKLIQVVASSGWNFPHIAGSQIIPLKNFDFSTSSLEANDVHVFVSNDGYDSAVAITKIAAAGFSYEKNFNLEGGLDAWRKKGYSVEQ